MKQLARTTPEAREEAMWLLLRRQIARYTQGDHESLPVETVENLLQSLLFTLEAAAGDATLEGLRRGQAILTRDVRRARLLYEEALLTACPFPNTAYHDTLRGMEGFFRQYDIQFAAHEIPCDIDYQLCLPVPQGWQGVRFLCEYLRRFVIENRFLRRFDSRQIAELLVAWSPDARGLLINLFEPVLLHAICSALLGEDPSCRLLDEAQRQRLLAMPIDKPVWLEATRTVAQRLGIEGAATLEYITQAAQQSYVGFSAAKLSGELASLFPHDDDSEARDEALFTDGAMMGVRALRTLIESMRGKDAPEKTAMLRQQVHSLRDFADVLDAVFYGEEVEVAFALLSPTEMQALLRSAEGRGSTWVEKLKRHI